MRRKNQEGGRTLEQQHNSEEGEAQGDEGGSADVRKSSAAANLMPSGAMLTSDII